MPQLLLADLAGRGPFDFNAAGAPEIVNVTADSVDSLVATIRPELHFRVPDRLTNSMGELGIHLTLTKLADFEPAALRTAINVLQALGTRIRETQVTRDELASTGRLGAWDDVDVSESRGSYRTLQAMWSSAQPLIDMVLAAGLQRREPKRREAAAQTLPDLAWQAFNEGGVAKAVATLNAVASQLHEKIEAMVSEVTRHHDYVSLHRAWAQLQHLAASSDVPISTVNISSRDLDEQLSERRSDLLRKISRFRIDAHKPIRVLIDTGLATGSVEHRMRELRSWGDLRGIAFIIAKEQETGR